MNRRDSGLAIAALIAAGLIGTGEALATTYYTTPSPAAGANCSAANPCALLTAVNGAFVVDGDEVVVGPGTYDQTGGGGLLVADAIDIHGAAGQPRPLIVTGAGSPTTGVAVIDAATVRDLDVHHSGGGFGVSLDGAGVAIGERLLVKAAGGGALPGGGAACVLGTGAIRDSVCQAAHNSPGMDGLTMIGSGAADDESATATNVTAIGASTLGAQEYAVYSYSQTGASQLLQAKNVIASGGDGDVRAETADGASSAAVLMINSNFASATSSGPGLEVVPTPGANANQTAEPLLADPFPVPDPFVSDLHQLAGSPTINAGTGGEGLGSADYDGQARCLGSAPDIGADEYTEAACPSNGDGGGSADTTAPDTQLTGRARNRVRTRSRRATARFRFVAPLPLASAAYATKAGASVSTEPGVSFGCKLDRRPWKPCSSPRRVRVKATARWKRHSFKVRATDASGNTDMTPARDRWRVRRMN